MLMMMAVYFGSLLITFKTFLFQTVNFPRLEKVMYSKLKLGLGKKIVSTHLRRVKSTERNTKKNSYDESL